jgi:hypothetical protein
VWWRWKKEIRARVREKRECEVKRRKPRVVLMASGGMRLRVSARGWARQWID